MVHKEEIPFVEYNDLDPRVAWIREYVAREVAERARIRMSCLLRACNGSE